MLANGNNAGIKADKNQFILKCVNSQITLIANGETLANVELPVYTPSIGTSGFDVFEGSQMKVNSLALKIFQSSSILPAPPLLNQVSLPPSYQPGETIFAWDMNDFIFGCGDGWWGRDASPCLWRKAYNRFVIGEHHTDNAILVTPNSKILTLFTYRPDLYDLPVEIQAETSFTSKGGGVALFCRATQNGRYEFYLQPDGKWFIRRDVNVEYGLPLAKHLTILAHGTVENFTPANAQMNATCNGSDLIFTLNGTELGRVQDTLYPEGQAGIFFDAFSEGTFTNVYIRRAE
jgi:hypothetical protein